MEKINWDLFKVNQIEIINPATESVVFKVTLQNVEQAHEVLSIAHLCQKEWKQVPLSKRIDLCLSAIVEFKKEKTKIAEEITEQMGKPITQALAEVDGMIFRTQKLIEIAESALAETSLAPIAGFKRKIAREPLGVVLNIPAWNYPLLTAVNVVVPAVLAGNSVIIKHSSKTPLCGEHFANAFKAAGAPHGLVSSLSLSHADTAQLIADPRIAHVSFTGSVQGGREVYRTAAENASSMSAWNWEARIPLMFEPTRIFCLRQRI